jgi:hypothetical protein
MTTHEFDAHCDTLPHKEPPYHEQLLVKQEFEETRNVALKQQGAIEALHNLSVTLSMLILRDDVKGDYLFGLHDALEVTKRNLAVMKGGIA